jgi:carbamate kinase
VVLALGGNAIAPAGTGGTAEEQIASITRAMRSIGALVEAGLEVIITHGNGPQVGNLLLKNDLAKDIVPPMPLDWCVAQTQATIGSAMVTALEEDLAARGLPIPVIAVLSRVLVDANDPGFANPTKPIGRYVDEAEARSEMQRRGHTWVRQGDKGWRRVVPSPEPQALLDGMSMRLVLDGGAVLIANGGGGIPMIRGDTGRLLGVEAVIDKDLAAALLARELEAERLVILTDVNGVAAGYGTPEEEWLDEVTVERLRELQVAGHFAAGSMGPKVEAVLRFADATGGSAVIGSLDELSATVDGRAGTRVRAGKRRTGVESTA